MAPEPVTERRPSRDAQLEVAWKWILRLCGLLAFLYVLLTKGGEAPMPVYVIIGGFIGLPNVFTLQQLLNARTKGDGE